MAPNPYRCGKHSCSALALRNLVAEQPGAATGQGAWPGRGAVDDQRLGGPTAPRHGVDARGDAAANHGRVSRGVLVLFEADALTRPPSRGGRSSDRRAVACGNV